MLVYGSSTPAGVGELSLGPLIPELKHGANGVETLRVSLNLLETESGVIQLDELRGGHCLRIAFSLSKAILVSIG
jgi:hypothetical protein